MSDPQTPADYRAEAERVRGLLEGTTEGEWYWRENDRMMQLLARRIWPWPEHYPDDLKEFAPEGMELHPAQILKAPKTGTPYAEYWPAEKDAALIAQSPALAQAYADLCERMAALLEARRWIPVAERLPEELMPVLISTRRRRLVGAWYGPALGWSAGGEVYKPADVTHWFPLPAPPQPEQVQP